MNQPPAAHETSQHETQRLSPAPSPPEPAPEPAPAASAAAGTPATPTSPAAHPHERRMIVRAGIVLAALLFTAAAGVLYLRWATMREPRCIFIVESSSALRGAEVTLRGLNLLEPHTAVVGRGDRFAIPFYLDYGAYTVHVTLNGATVAEAEVDLNEKQPYQRLDLTRAPAPPPAPPPTTAASPDLPPPVILPGMTSQESGLSP